MSNDIFILDNTLSKLNNFIGKLRSTQTKDDSNNWMNHKLKFSGKTYQH